MRHVLCLAVIASTGAIACRSSAATNLDAAIDAPVDAAGPVTTYAGSIDSMPPMSFNNGTCDYTVVPTGNLSVDIRGGLVVAGKGTIGGTIAVIGPCSQQPFQTSAQVQFFGTAPVDGVIRFINRSPESAPPVVRAEATLLPSDTGFTASLAIDLGDVFGWSENATATLSALTAQP